MGMKKMSLLPLRSWLSCGEMEHPWNSGLAHLAAHPTSAWMALTHLRQTSVLLGPAVAPIARPISEGGHSSLPVAQVTNRCLRCSVFMLCFQSTNESHFLPSKHSQNLLLTPRHHLASPFPQLNSVLRHLKALQKTDSVGQWAGKGYFAFLRERPWYSTCSMPHSILA